MKLYNSTLKNISCLLIIAMAFGLGGCFDLEEEVFDEITENNLTITESDAIAMMASAYNPLRFVMDWMGYFDVQEESGDVMITPSRPAGWDDGGTYKRMHWHTWTNIDWQPRNVWLTAYEAINNANRVLDMIDDGTLPISDEDALKYKAELRAIRALWYAMLCDSHGNVPLVVHFNDEVPEQNTRLEVYNFVMSELSAVVNDLPTEVNASTYGRMTKWAALHQMARMYLNSEVYIGEAKWQECINACDTIIASGLFELDADYQTTFAPNNDATSKEMVLVIPYDYVYAQGNSQVMKQLLPQHREVFQMQVQPWGGSSGNPQFIDSYQPNDKRLGYTWLMGDQINPKTGEVVVTLHKEMPSIDSCAANDGYRVHKYAIEQGARNQLNNDVPYFRYTDVLMMKAECLLRTGRGTEAATIVSEVRKRSFDDIADATVTATELEGNSTMQYSTIDKNGNIDQLGDQTPIPYGRFLDELGWEFACEFRRRTDLIRFNVFQTKNWYNHTPQGAHTTIFPIGLEELNTNPKLNQNTGYPGA